MIRVVHKSSQVHAITRCGPVFYKFLNMSYSPEMELRFGVSPSPCVTSVP